MGNETLKDMFFAECEELIEALTEGLQSISDGAWSLETVHAIFRAVHSIKGAAGAFSLTDLVTFSHRFETVLDLIRSEVLPISPEVLRVIIRAGDMLAVLVDTARMGGGDAPASMSALLSELEGIAGVKAAPVQEVPIAAADDDDFTFMPLTVSIASPTQFAIRFAPTPAFYANGHEPARYFEMLSDMGTLDVCCDTGTVPPLDRLDPDEAHLAWNLTLEGATSEGAIRDVFAFAEGLCDLTISPLETAQTCPSSAVTELSEPAPILSEPEPERAPAMTATTAAPPSDGAASSDAVLTPLDGAPGSRKPAAAAMQPTLRVDPERVDKLINTVGELIINQAVLAQNLAMAGGSLDTEMLAALEDYARLAREIQEGVMAIRAQPVKSLFQRMARVVREAADATGKTVKFETEGEATEIDKTMLERLADPLTHMLRNAVDHGVEKSEVRKSAGKDEAGTVRLRAAHRSGHVQIEVSDDGAGLDYERIQARAVSKGLVSPDAKLSEPEIATLLFAPGFSTAENVTNLSGRGVGMDVVRTTITSLGGRIGIAGRKGEGSVFSITLPLTLAVLDGMLVRLGTEPLVIPLGSIRETVRPNLWDIRHIGAHQRVLAVRGNYVPVVDLGRVLGMARNISEPSTFVIVTNDSGESLAVEVDAILDQRQVVIKSMEGNYGAIRGISAATILGDGKIALIVDADALFTMAPLDDRSPVPDVMEA